jgi:hypothetical protein
MLCVYLRAPLVDSAWKSPVCQFTKTTFTDNFFGVGLLADFLFHIDQLAFFWAL